MEGMTLGGGVGFDPRVAMAPAQPLMPSIMDRLHNARATLTDAEAELAAVRTRLFGAYPTGGQTASAKPVEASAEAEVMALIDHLMEVAQDIRASASALNNRI